MPSPAEPLTARGARAAPSTTTEPPQRGAPRPAGPLPAPAARSPALPTAGWPPPRREPAEGLGDAAVPPEPGAEPPRARTSRAEARRRRLPAARRPPSASRRRRLRRPPLPAAGQRRWLQHFRRPSGRPRRASMVGWEDPCRPPLWGELHSSSRGLPDLVFLRGIPPAGGAVAAGTIEAQGEEMGGSSRCPPSPAHRHSLLAFCHRAES